MQFQNRFISFYPVKKKIHFNKKFIRDTFLCVSKFVACHSAISSKPDTYLDVTIDPLNQLGATKITPVNGITFSRGGQMSISGPYYGSHLTFFFSLSPLLRSASIEL